ncbi:hypothetical protein P691DRAFT_769981 [Macrolepiota fuliginosa MF-IS2]|uniref:Uncharacterized protein n=1 Tax=Macrolepiota fuliginosa MF-IS2 TaxID=1400762 RepID=A0A9P5WXA3_9AGAR|nr:hypothetical protein P691DRAFT_769981 [Macrolepiota fuliginosa MF-IS2]
MINVPMLLTGALLRNSDNLFTPVRLNNTVRAQLGLSTQPLGACISLPTVDGGNQLTEAAPTR